MNPNPFSGRLRQVHLDFHNSPFLPDLLADLDPAALARRFKEAHVNSVVVFAKCVHGMGYYPSKIVPPHPALNGRDFTGEMIEALHREGIRAPIYTIIAWEEYLAQAHPEWMQMTDEGCFAQLSHASDNKSQAPGRFRFLNFLHPDFQACFEAHLDELLLRYPCDGLFLDMLVVHPKADWSDHAIAFREKHGLLGRDPLTQARFETLTQVAFAERFTRQILDRQPSAAVFYNSENRLFTDASLGTLARKHTQSHFEIESLPSGFWGYRHFPRVARALSHQGLPWLGMTGRFQKMWGDFGGIKPDAALEFECFQTQAMGGANSVGDQLHPRGTLDRGGIALIGRVFAQCAAAEPFYAHSQPLPRVAIVCPHHPSLDESVTAESEEGAVALCQESHYECAVVTSADDLSAYELVILPDELVLDAAFAAKLHAYHAAGGRFLASFRAGLSEPGKNSVGLDFLPVLFESESPRFPTYWRARDPFSYPAGEDDRVIYTRGLNVRPKPQAEIWLDRVLPYFQRSDLRFTSHFQAPPMPTPAMHPALIAGPRCAYFADPVFREFRATGSISVAGAFRSVLHRLIGPPAFGEGLKSTVQVHPRRRGDDLLLTLLHYLPRRKGHDIDVIEERLGFGGQVLHLPASKPVQTITCFPDGQALEKSPEGTWLLPASAEGRLLLTVTGYFASPTS